MSDYEPAYEAVYSIIRAADRDVHTNALIWRCVQAALDAVHGEESK